MTATRASADNLTSRDRQRVLVIDDDPLFRNLLVSALRRDYLVSVASDGQEGFHKASEHPPDIAIIDIQMPGWDGVQTLKAFRGNALLNKVATVVLTSDSSRQTVLSAIQAGAQDYVIKTNFSKDDLLKKLERFRNGVVASTAPVKTERASLPATAREQAPASSASAAEMSPVESDSMTVAVADQPTGSADPEKLQELLDNWE